ncbi:ribosomal protein S5 domain 2-like protein [Wilcoxina mikolae CBS 423.85]|nr:ribosomal protein S5 domain 2-like protein [Wilcoxina mikolae CBS 423.85]
MAIAASLTILPRADGSATFKSGLTTVIASVNGPMEVKSRDELPDKTFIEVNVRPAIGVGGTRERALESRIISALSPLILRTYHPRTLLQIAVQLVEAEDHSDTTAILPVCLNAATLALIDAGTPLASVLIATTVFLDADEGGNGGSKHVLAYAKGGRCVFAESIGSFDEAEFARAVEEGRRECALDAREDVDMDRKETVGMVVRRVIEKKVEADMRWKEL